jgi:hypothetical protein
VHDGGAAAVAVAGDETRSLIAAHSQTATSSIG